MESPAHIHRNTHFARITIDQVSEVRFHSSSFVIDGEMRADSLGLFLLMSC
jgi:hypothetical protein